MGTGVMMEKNGKTAESGTIDWQAAQDAERYRIAEQVFPIAIAVMTSLSAFFIAAFFILDQPWQWTWMVFEMVQAVVLLTIAYALVRRGHLAGSIYLATITLNLTVVIGPALVAGMIVPGMLASLIAFIFARLLASPTEKRIVALITCLALVTGIALSSFQVFDILPIPAWVQTITAISGAIIVVLLIARILDLYDRRYQISLGQTEAYARKLDTQKAALEQHASDLTHQTRYLRATAEVAQDAASVLDPQQLLSQVVVLVSERFNMYHAGIFLLDRSGEWAILQAASSAGGQIMLKRGHRLRVGHEGIVGYVTGRGEARFALDVGGDAVFFDNPDLPDTRSEMALPLQARGEIIGALDVQSTEREAFTTKDVAVLQTLADQVAMAISNARLFQQAQESLDAERRAYSQLTREEWSRVARTRGGLGYRYDQHGIVALNGDDKHGNSEAQDGDGGLPELTLPVSVHGHVIAQVNAHKPAEAGEWTAEETLLMETLTQRLGLALDNARLHQDSQRRALREQLTRQITDKVRAVPDVDAIAQTAAEELARVLGSSRGFVKLSTSPLDENGYGDNAES
jgi:GAF domain-containing protein